MFDDSRVEPEIAILSQFCPKFGWMRDWLRAGARFGLLAPKRSRGHLPQYSLQLLLSLLFFLLLSFYARGA
jgi:hypothetical protein